MITFVLADLSENFTITIAKKDFYLEKGKSYRFNYATKSHVKDVLKCLSKHKGLFRYLETNNYINCFQTFSLAKDRIDVDASKVSNNFKSKKKSDSGKLVKVHRDDPDGEEERGRDFFIENDILSLDSESVSDSDVVSEESSELNSEE